MMKKACLCFFIVTSILTLSSCKAYLKAKNNIKDPEIETVESSQHYLSKRKIDTTNSIYFKDFDSYITAMNSDVTGIPDAFFYNQKGEFVTYQKSSEDCNAHVDEFISDLKNFNSRESDSNRNINKLLTLTQTGQAKPVEFEKGYEIYVVMTWAVFIGKVNDPHTFHWIELLKKAQKENIDIKYYLLNADAQKIWNMNEHEKESYLNIKI